jgi:hypothetical protein
MYGMFATIDIPSWISALSSAAGVGVAILALVISGIATFRIGKMSPDYAIVSGDGVILRHRGFGDFGLYVELESVPVAPDREGTVVPEYRISFTRVPDYFEVTTMQGAVVSMKQSGPLEYRLRFVGAGYGSPVMQCNFKVQAF